MKGVKIQMVDSTRLKVNSLLRIAETTADPYLRERCCLEAKTLLDEMEPFAVVSEGDDPVRTFVTTYYQVTVDPHDRVLKRDFDNKFLEWNMNGTETIDRKTLTRRVISMGATVARSYYGEKRGVYVYLGLREIEHKEGSDEDGKET